MCEVRDDVFDLGAEDNEDVEGGDSDLSDDDLTSGLFANPTREGRREQSSPPTPVNVTADADADEGGGGEDEEREPAAKRSKKKAGGRF